MMRNKRRTDFGIQHVDLKCKTFKRNTASNGGITLGTGRFAGADTGTPWLVTDGGTNSFTHNSVNYGLESMSVDIVRQYADQDLLRVAGAFDVC